MRPLIYRTATLSIALAPAAEAKGCIKGAIVGGIAGHVARAGSLLTARSSARYISYIARFDGPI